MAEKHRLRMSRAGTILNLTSREQESALGKALKLATAKLLQDFGLDLAHEKTLKIPEIVEHLARDFPEADFYEPSPRATMQPDGGVLSIRDKSGTKYPILISEVKNQGTNDLRKKEGKPKQAKGNAIERLGKNVIGIRAAMLGEDIVPFVCFGYGIDFADGSSILDRVATIAMFGRLNEMNVLNTDRFNRGSFYFREKRWTEDEMAAILVEVGTKSIYYYYAKYGEKMFVKSDL
jgi:type II restriction enzyme